MNARDEAPPASTEGDGASGSSLILTIVIGILTALTVFFFAKRFLSASTAPPKKTSTGGRTRKISDSDGDDGDELVSAFDVIREGKTSSKAKPQAKGVKKPEEQLARPSVQKKAAAPKIDTPAPSKSSQKGKSSQTSSASKSSKPTKITTPSTSSSSNDAGASASPEIHRQDEPDSELASVSSGGASPEAVRDDVVSDDLPRDVRAKLNYTLVGYDASMDADADAEAGAAADVDDADEKDVLSPETPKREPEPEDDPEPEVEDEPEPVPVVKKKSTRRRPRRI